VVKVNKKGEGGLNLQADAADSFFCSFQFFVKNYLNNFTDARQTITPRLAEVP
jgi:hypothetical protein